MKVKVCDECSKVIFDKAEMPKDKIVYFSVHTYHNGWGNDSIDSHEHLNICSQKCLIFNMQKYFEEARGTESYDIDREEA